MLKCIRGLVMSVVVLLASAYASPAYAASADIIITQVQAGGVSAALQEIVIIYNNSNEDVDISDWCLKNKSNVSFACFFRFDPHTAIILPAHHYATVGSNALSAAHNFVLFSTAYVSINQSSGAIVGGSDTITLIDSTGTAIDSYSWTTSIIGGMTFIRQKVSSLPDSYGDTDHVPEWNIEPLRFIPENGVEIRTIEIDLCQNIDGMQLDVPEGFEITDTSECTPIVQGPSLLPVRLSELLPNAVGSDAGNEFIELYNPNDTAIDLTGYSIQYGAEFEKYFTIPAETMLEPLSYTVLRNGEITFSLPNSIGYVRLVTDTGVTIDETGYEDTKDGVAWAYIDDTWQSADQPTPGASNLRNLMPLKVEKTDEKIQQPCAANQYRSAETNRCRLIATTTAVQTPCKDNQYRSEETNRCRNIASVDTPAACKEGQERNPETNRCRNIVKMSNAGYAVLGTQTTTDGSGYVWLAVIACLALAITYAIWEWRLEIRKLIRKLAVFLRIRK